MIKETTFQPLKMTFRSYKFYGQYKILHGATTQPPKTSTPHKVTLKCYNYTLNYPPFRVTTAKDVRRRQAQEPYETTQGRQVDHQLLCR
jgi:hypothetical protein